MNNDEFCSRLADLCSPLKLLYDENVREYGELLPYLFLSDICEIIADNPESECRIPLLMKLEKGLKYWDTEIGELIAIGFVESLSDSQ